MATTRPNHGERNDWLFRHCLKQARHCASFEDLLDCAETANDDLPPPLPIAEVAQTAKSVWRYPCEGKNWLGNQAVAQIPESTRILICQGPSGCDALALYTLLLTKHGAREGDFCIAIHAMCEAGVRPGVSMMHLRRARDHLRALGVIDRVHVGGRGQGDPAHCLLCRFLHPI